MLLLHDYMDKSIDGKTDSSRKNGGGGEFRLAMRIVMDFGVSIAVPAVVAALMGVRLDSHFGTKPWLLVIMLVIAFVLTAWWVYKKAKKYAKLYEKIK